MLLTLNTIFFLYTDGSDDLAKQSIAGNKIFDNKHDFRSNSVTVNASKPANIAMIESASRNTFQSEQGVVVKKPNNREHAVFLKIEKYRNNNNSVEHSDEADKSQQPRNGKYDAILNSKTSSNVQSQPIQNSESIVTTESDSIKQSEQVRVGFTSFTPWQ